ncbi:MAG: hypothetical protein WAK13_04870 [Terriglobales bacterium]
MSITVQPELESRLRELAAAEGVTVERLLEILVQSQVEAAQRIEELALEGLGSGEPIAPDADYWEAKHRRLDEQARKAQ